MDEQPRLVILMGTYVGGGMITCYLCFVIKSLLGMKLEPDRKSIFRAAVAAVDSNYLF
jgi:hypothetical protein